MFYALKHLTLKQQEKRNKLHRDHSVQSTLDSSAWMDSLTGILHSPSKNLFKAKPVESLIQQGNTPLLSETQLSRSYHLQPLLQENLQEVQKDFPGFNHKKNYYYGVCCMH